MPVENADEEYRFLPWIPKWRGEVARLLLGEKKVDLTFELRAQKNLNL
jgi:hypothetical protein